MSAPATTNVWFGGRLALKNGTAVSVDKLGSRGKYYPYGGDRSGSNPVNGQEKFATYTRDAETGLDYADQRYYQPGTGMFLSPDPYRARGGPGDPGSWNRYAYTRGDPINRYDPFGNQDCPPGYIRTPDGESCTPAPDSAIGPVAPPQFPVPGACDALARKLGECDDREPVATRRPGLGLANGEQAAIFNRAISQTEQLLKTNDCSNLFGVSDPTLSLDTAHYVYFTLIDPSDPSGTRPAGADVWASTNPDTATVTINSAGNFMGVSSWRVYGVTLNADQMRDFTLLHELGHITRALGDDRQNQDLSDRFNRMILQNCFGQTPTQ